MKSKALKKVRNPGIMVLLYRQKYPKPPGCEENPAGLGSALHPSNGPFRLETVFIFITGDEGCPLCFANSPYFRFFFKAGGLAHRNSV
jgi:hypothetical protein